MLTDYYIMVNCSWRWHFLRSLLLADWVVCSAQSLADGLCSAQPSADGLYCAQSSADGLCSAQSSVGELGSV